ncbi:MULTISPECIES: hypothetical protein [unclassified Lonepinella]|uniref:hypothetical protein n=1 Tax=unclassified Lonepinella TaxID=2642006 RepID=UPI0036D9864D
MSVNEFQGLLLNKSEIEKILGLSINLTGNSDYEDFKMLKMIDVNDVIAIFLDLPVGIYANDIREHYRYNTIFNAICEYSENNKSDDIQVECDINGNIYNIKVSHNFARQWAITHGLSWNVPPYREINLNKETENNEEILQLQSRITELEQQLADTQKQLADLQNSLPDESISKSKEQIRDTNKALFALLCHQNKNYSESGNLNALTQMINIDLKHEDIQYSSKISYNTLDNLIKESPTKYKFFK